MLDSFDEGFVIGLFDVAAREIGLDRDRTHVLDRNPGIECGLDEKAVIIDAVSIHLGEALTDRLDVADLSEAPAKGRIKTERRRRLAGVLLRGGDKNTRRCRIHEINPPCRAADKVSGTRSPAGPQSQPSPPCSPKKLPSVCQRRGG